MRWVLFLPLFHTWGSEAQTSWLVHPSLQSYKRTVGPSRHLTAALDVSFSPLYICSVTKSWTFRLLILSHCLSSWTYNYCCFSNHLFSCLDHLFPTLYYRNFQQYKKVERIEQRMCLLPSCVCVCVCTRVHQGSVVLDSLGRHGRSSARLLCLWNFPGENIGVGCHFFLQNLPDPGIKPVFSTSSVLAGGLFTTQLSWKPRYNQHILMTIHFIYALHSLLPSNCVMLKWISGSILIHL